MEENESLLDKLNDGLSKHLDNQLKICYNYSANVMQIYKNLLRKLSFLGDISISDSIFSDEITELRECIMKEHDAYEKLLVYDKFHFLTKIDALINSDSDNSVEYMRYRNKLQFIKNIFMGYKITPNKLKLDNIPNDICFDIYCVILAVMHISTFKNIKEKLDSLSFENKQDKMFVDSLNIKLETKLLYKICSNDLLEILILYNNMDIDKIPYVDINIALKSLSKVYYNMDIDEHINDILFNLIVADISMVQTKKQLNNSSDDVFEYLYFTTRIEVIMSYMNKEYLKKLYEHCKNINFNNVYISADVKNKIKKRISMGN